MTIKRPQTPNTGTGGANFLNGLPKLRIATSVSGDRPVAQHRHNFVELVFCVEGEIQILVDGHQPLSGQPGTLFVLPDGVPHSQKCFGQWRTICVLYFGGDGAICTNPRTLDLRLNTLFLEWLEGLCSLTNISSGQADPVADALLTTILAGITQNDIETCSNETRHPRLSRALHFLDQNLADPVSAEDISSAASTSYSHLSSLFNAEFGCGPLRYHTKLRLSRAAKLLLNPYIRIGEVAFEAGFFDQNHFARAFRKEFQLSPSQWRKQRSDSTV